MNLSTSLQVDRVCIRFLLLSVSGSEFLTPLTPQGQFEKLERQLRREFMFDRVTGLLLLFPSCLLHVVEVSSASSVHPKHHAASQPASRPPKRLRLCPAVVQRRPAVCPEEHATPGGQVAPDCWLVVTSVTSVGSRLTQNAGHSLKLSCYNRKKLKRESKFGLCWLMALGSSGLLEASKVVLLIHDPQRRIFQQWSYKVRFSHLSCHHYFTIMLLRFARFTCCPVFRGVKMMFVEQMPHDADNEDEENTDSLVSTVLEALQKLNEHLQESSVDVSLSRRRLVCTSRRVTVQRLVSRSCPARSWTRSSTCVSLRRSSTSSWSETCC